MGPLHNTQWFICIQSVNWSSCGQDFKKPFLMIILQYNNNNTMLWYPIQTNCDRVFNVVITQSCIPGRLWQQVTWFVVCLVLCESVGSGTELFGCGQSEWVWSPYWCAPLAELGSAQDTTVEHHQRGHHTHECMPVHECLMGKALMGGAWPHWGGKTRGHCLNKSEAEIEDHTRSMGMRSSCIQFGTESVHHS